MASYCKHTTKQDKLGTMCSAEIRYSKQLMWCVETRRWRRSEICILGHEVAVDIVLPAEEAPESLDYRLINPLKERGGFYR